MAGGSIIHGHAQATPTRNTHYPKVERLRRAALSYAAEHGSNYFADLCRVHEALGLGIAAPGGIRAFASLTPVKEKELVLVGPSLEAEALRHAAAAALEGYVRDSG